MSASPAPLARTAPGVRLRLEARVGHARSPLYEPGDGGFLVGSVPGCDMRLPGVNLPPVIALIARHPTGAVLRKLAPVLPILVNGRPVATAELANGDVIGLGPTELIVHLEVTAPPDHEAREQELTRRYAELEVLASRVPTDAGPRDEDLARQEQELDAARREFHGLRSQFADRCQEQRDKLLTRQRAVLRGRPKLKARVRAVEGREGEVAQRAEEADRVFAEGQSLTEQARRERAATEQRERLLADRQGRAEQLERAVAEGQAALDVAQRKHQTELVRLDRIQAGIDLRQKQLDQRSTELEALGSQLDADRVAADEHARHLDEWQLRLTTQEREQSERQEEQDARDADITRRAAALDSQQATLTALRGRLEKLRDDLRQQEQVLADQRAMHEASETDLKARLEEATRLRDDAQADRDAAADERRQVDDKRAMLEQASAQLRLARDAVATEQDALDERAREVEELAARADQVQLAAAKLEQERRALDERQSAVARTERSLNALQEQLDRRVGDLDERQRAVEGGEDEIARAKAAAEAELAEEQERTKQAAGELEQLHQELLAQATAQDERDKDLAGREVKLADQTQRLIDEARTLATQKQATAAERRAWEAERQAAAEKDRHARDEVAALMRHVPELEAKVDAGLQRLSRARAQMADVQAAARAGRDEMRSAREQIAAEAERVRLTELDLAVARDEHRLAVEAFRQQMAEGQSRLAELRQNPPAATPEAPRRRPAEVLLDEAGDGRLGDVLGQLGLIDEATLDAIRADARRQRRPLRQALLTGGFVTMYQLALIEAGNLGGLALGPVRVIDKLPSGPRESAFQVLDPRRGAARLLRHLAEPEMADAVRPDEFRARFAAAACVRHPNVAAVEEVLEVSGRPAALLEWVSGLPSADWPGLAAAPGAWYRLVCQASLGLHAAHEQGLCHGHLDPSSFVLNAEGVLKVTGLGEPLWLASTPTYDETVGADLVAFGRVIAGWAATPPGGKASKSKPLPDELARLVSRAEGGDFESAKGLLEELERVGVRVPASGAAWDRLLSYVREQSSPRADAA